MACVEPAAFRRRMPGGRAGRDCGGVVRNDSGQSIRTPRRLRSRLRNRARQAGTLAWRQADRAGRYRLDEDLRGVPRGCRRAVGVHLRPEGRGRLCPGRRHASVHVGARGRHEADPQLHSGFRVRGTPVPDVLDGRPVQCAAGEHERTLHPPVRPGRDRKARVRDAGRRPERAAHHQQQRHRERRIPRLVLVLPLCQGQGDGPVHCRVLRFRVVRHPPARPGGGGGPAGCELHAWLYRREDRAVRHGLRHHRALSVPRDARRGRKRCVRRLLLSAQGHVFLQPKEQLAVSTAPDDWRGMAAGRLLDGDGSSRDRVAI